MRNIQSLLESIPEELLMRQQKKETLKRRMAEFADELVIYGHGNLGAELCGALERTGYSVKYFIDARKPTDLDKKALNLQDAAEFISPNALIIIAIYDVYREYSLIKRSLEDSGFQNIMSAFDLCVWPELFTGWNACPSLSRDIEHIPSDQAAEAYSLMSDALSRQTYEDVLRYFITGNTDSFHLCPDEQQYMPDNIYLPDNGERIVDCGAFNGDTMRAFYSKTAGWQSYTAIEPDLDNFKNLCLSIQKDLPVRLSERVKAINASVSDETGSAHFQTRGTTSSHIVLDSTEAEDVQSVPVIRLDDVMQEPVSLIKMDIEGFEFRALKGAERLIRKNQPLLMICGYHHMSDLWEIPLYMKKILPNHHIFLRNYAGVIEYVFYAVPENRLLSVQ